MADTENEKKNNLSNVDFTNKKVRVQSPRSKKVLAELGLEEDKLYKLSKKEYIAKHPELKGASNEVKNKHYEHYEQKRQDKIEEAKKRRD